MATQELHYPLLDQPKANPSPVLAIVAIIFHVIMVITAFLFTRGDPSCDQDLVSWAEPIYLLSIGGIVLEILKLAFSKNENIRLLRASVWVAYLVMLVWLNWPVFASETCDEALWYFFLVLAVLGDVSALIGLVVFGCLLRIFSFEELFSAYLAN